MMTAESSLGILAPPAAGDNKPARLEARLNSLSADGAKCHAAMLRRVAMQELPANYANLRE
jgi:hypothetical protein